MPNNSSTKKFDTRFITRTAILLAITIIVQFIKMPQLVTGSIVNAMLIISAYFVGIWSGVSIGLLTPIIAFLVGLMSFPILIPFIMIGNTLYVMLFKTVKNNIIGMIAGAVVKFLWLAASVKYILTWFNVNVPQKIVAAFTLPQLATAIIGGILSIFLIFILTGYFNKSKK
ncbi:ECF transporter S component [Thermoanaerobacterium sp. CMT5567-10]|uniref:ECF transporter S component n=1 Tax=Thermoanaerobacterium sp. CMT5567-10 TaxID=3061989 RepID=UPI0026E04B06|nr:ECF transporter S component [Thermoanaerobacterium sp. CMT5567-10]WKV10016.1 ECF transporter S component [Thermoanaerobacterium sp. CMT5567-10]